MAQNGKTNGASGGGESTAAARRCANCGKPVVKKYRPFCSLRCANLDLGNWLGGRYVLPGSDSSPWGTEDVEEGEEDNGHERE